MSTPPQEPQSMQFRLVGDAPVFGATAFSVDVGREGLDLAFAMPTSLVPAALTIVRIHLLAGGVATSLQIGRSRLSAAIKQYRIDPAPPAVAGLPGIDAAMVHNYIVNAITAAETPMGGAFNFGYISPMILAEPPSNDGPLEVAPAVQIAMPPIAFAHAYYQLLDAGDALMANRSALPYLPSVGPTPELFSPEPST